LLEGYDYLAMLDQEEKDKKNKDNEDEEEGGDEMTDESIQRSEKLRQRKPEDYRDEEEVKQHDEL
jgi:hypothetical protein